MKTFRIIIALALFLTSIAALDMSSAKRRTETSAYVSLYTSLGLTSGFKSMAAESYDDAIFEYFLMFNVGKGQKPINVGSQEDTQQRNGFDDFNGEGVSFYINNSWKNIPADFKKKFCNEFDECLILYKDLKGFTLLSSHNFYYAVTYLNSLGKEDRFHIILTNGAEVRTNNDIIVVTRVQMEAQETSIISNAQKIDAEFLRYVNQVISSSNDVILKYNEMLEQNDKSIKNSARNLENNEKKLKTFIEKKKNLENEITTLNLKIAEREIKINNTNAEKQKCNNEYINLIFLRDQEELKVKAKKEQLVKDIADRKVLKSKALKKIFYYLEACYFYRLFGEKLIKAEADLDPALTGKNVKTTEAKLAKAFYPIKFQIAETGSK